MTASDTGVTQEIRGDHEGGRDVFGERHVGKATRRGCGKGLKGRFRL